MPIYHCVEQSPDPRPYQHAKKGTKNIRTAHSQDFLRLEGSKCCKCDITAVFISSMSANSSFPPVGAEEILHLQHYRRNHQR